jgi:cation transport ATPase
MTGAGPLEVPGDHKKMTLKLSISFIANAAAARRMDFAPAASVPRNQAEIASAASHARPLISPSEFNPEIHEIRLAAAAASGKPSNDVGTTPSTDGTNQDANRFNSALRVLFGYIPIEVLTLYVAFVAALHQPGKITIADNITFIAFLFVTPIVVWLAYAATVKGAKKPLPIQPSQWPVWEMFAATVAYFAWAFALPDSPFSSRPWYSSALAGVVVLVASSALGLLAPLFQIPIKQSKRTRSAAVRPKN